MKWNPLWKHCSDEKYGKRIKHPDFQGDDEKQGGWIKPMTLYELQKREKEKMGSTGLDLIKILKDNNGKLPDDFNISEYETIFEQSKEKTDDVTTQEISSTSTKKRRKSNTQSETPKVFKHIYPDLQMESQEIDVDDNIMDSEYSDNSD